MLWAEKPVYHLTKKKLLTTFVLTNYLLLNIKVNKLVHEKHCRANTKRL